MFIHNLLFIADWTYINVVVKSFTFIFIEGIVAQMTTFS